MILQEHAAIGALGLIPPEVPLQVLVGPGNNGGDALALARLARSSTVRPAPSIKPMGAVLRIPSTIYTSAPSSRTRRRSGLDEGLGPVSTPAAGSAVRL